MVMCVGMKEREACSALMMLYEGEMVMRGHDAIALPQFPGAMMEVRGQQSLRRQRFMHQRNRTHAIGKRPMT